MLNKEQLQTIEKEVRHLLERLGVAQEEIKVEQQTEGLEEPTVEVSVQAPDPKIIIGERGQTLFELQHIVKLMLRKKIAEPFYLSVDVNEYKKNKEEYLRDLAKTCADEVVLFKKPKELSPMPAAERRIVHMVLADRTDVTSESIGEGADRHIVIKLKE